MATWNKKTYQMVASVLMQSEASGGDTETLRILKRDFADIFRMDNDRFDSDRFLKACGVDDDMSADYYDACGPYTDGSTETGGVEE